ncbi:hypothetical protein EUX98_g2772 [Antrodiella citrinella]|uniref:Uncharacterized protein n=1 Tax=Antrodiella citrinella TaxID=2447956 RepID=A0A4V3XJ22_9APHY|nr:hypothetical protein EUX98_g2772 [Antrodiella citrinella]
MPARPRGKKPLKVQQVPATAPPPPTPTPKRPRAATTSLSTAPAPKKKQISGLPSIEDDEIDAHIMADHIGFPSPFDNTFSDSLPGADPAATEVMSPPPRAHNTRAGNASRRPGKEAGVAPRTAQEVHAKAQVKKSTKEKKSEAKIQVQQDQDRTEVRGNAKIAEILNRQDEDDVEERRYLSEMEEDGSDDVDVNHTSQSRREKPKKKTEAEKRKDNTARVWSAIDIARHGTLSSQNDPSSSKKASKPSRKNLFH